MDSVWTARPQYLLPGSWQNKLVTCLTEVPPGTWASCLHSGPLVSLGSRTQCGKGRDGAELTRAAES